MAAETEVEARDADLPRYAEVLFRAARYKVLWGGRGGAKSRSIARALLLVGLQRTIRVLCARELQKSIKDSVHRLLSDEVDRLKLPYEVLQAEIRGPNGTLFIFEGLRSNVTKIKSLEGIDICWVEEAERVSEDSWKVLIPTIRKPGSEIWISFNPYLESDPTYRRFILAPPAGAVVLKVSWEDNPWFHETELPAEMTHAYAVDPDAAAHVWGGECVQATDAQILRGKWVVEEFEPVTEASLPEDMPEEDRRAALWDGPYHGADWGFANDPCTLVQVWIHDQVLYVAHEAYKIGLELDDTPAYWMRHVPGSEEHVVRADSARPDSISYVRRHGYPRIEGVAKGPESVKEGIAHLRQYRQIVVHPRCKHTADECRHYSYKVDDRTGDILPIIVDKHNHCIDGIRYALAPMIRPAATVHFWSLDDDDA